MQNRKAAPALRLEVADRIGVRHPAGGNQLLLTQGLDGVHAVAQLGGAFKFERLRGGKHLLPDLFGDALVVSRQQALHLPHPLPVFRFIRRAPAPALAVSHLKVQARPILPDIARKLSGAVRQPEGQTQGVNHFLRQITTAVGAVVFRPVFRDL